MCTGCDARTSISPQNTGCRVRCNLERQVTWRPGMRPNISPLMPKAVRKALPSSLSRGKGSRCALAKAALASGLSPEMPKTSAPACTGYGEGCIKIGSPFAGLIASYRRSEIRCTRLEICMPLWYSQGLLPVSGLAQKALLCRSGEAENNKQR